MPENNDYDLIVIGSGPGGYVAAIRASQLGLKTAVIEKDKPGGVCLNIGCIPSKALIHQADNYLAAEQLERIGLKVDRSGLDYAKVYQASRKAADQLSKGVQFLLKKNEIAYVQGTGKLAGPKEVVVAGDDGEKTLRAKFILLATGSRPREIPGFEFDEKTILSSTGLLMLQELPKSLIVLGSGYIGMEFAYVMSAFGVKVHVVEMLDQVLPLEDPDVAAVVEKAFVKRGVEFTTGAKATAVKKSKGKLTVTLENADGKTSEVSAEKMLVAVGRVPNTDDIGLDAVGIKTERGFVPVGDYCQTKVPGIYAIGDITQTLALAHVASKEGELAAEHMAGHGGAVQRVDNDLVPTVIFCEPQIAGVGLSETRAKKLGREVQVATFNFRAVGKAIATGAPEGFVKVLCDPKTRAILGVTVVGAEATELIHEAVLAKTSELLPEDIATMIHGHPTLSESLMEAMRGIEGWMIHA